MAPAAPAFHVDVKWLAKEAVLAGTSSAPRRPVVVGGSGLLGSNLVVFLAHVPGVACIKVVDMRPPRPEVGEALRKVGVVLEFVEYCLGSDGNEETLESVVEGSDCVFSTVTPHVQHATEEQFYATNQEGVKRLVEACVAKGVPRMVHLSSIAVTSHFVDSINQSEADPLPPMENYLSPYDLSKLYGERTVLNTNGAGGLATCSIRVGGIMLSPWDFIFANFWPVIPGLFFAPQGKNIDFMDGRDVCRALLMAAQGLQDHPKDVAGEAFFVTKANGASVSPGGLGKHCAKHLGFPIIHVPDWVIWFACFWVLLYHHVRKWSGCRVPGVPPHRFLQMPYSEQTFDNSKARGILGFSPKLDLDDSVSRIVSLYLQEQRQRGRVGSSSLFAHSSMMMVLIFSVLTVIATAHDAVPFNV